MNQNKFTIQEIEAHGKELQKSIIKFDKFAEFITPMSINKSLHAEYDLYIEYEYLCSNGKILLMGRFLTK